MYIISNNSGSQREQKNTKISSPRLPRSADALSSTITSVYQILIPPYPVIATYIRRGSLMNLTR